MSKQTIRIKLSPAAEKIVDALSKQGFSKQDIISTSINAVEIAQIAKSFHDKKFVKHLSEDCRLSTKATFGISHDARKRLDELKKELAIRGIEANFNVITSYAVRTYIRGIIVSHERDKEIEAEIQKRLKKIAADVMEISSLWHERTAKHDNPDEVEGSEGMMYFVEGFYQIYEG